jgi:predicted DsbA family dithiol-disulfide isomerase
MLIEIWSDVVCPWCYIGKRRLESALERFEHAAEVEVVYRSFELDPSAPREGHQPVVESLAQKYRLTPGAAREMMESMAATAAEEGLVFDYDQATHTNTVDAHRLLHLALDEGGPRLQGALKETLLAAYFTRGESMGDHDVLRKAAVEVGLDGVVVDRVLAGTEHLDAVEGDVARARGYGVTGVPFFVIDQKYGVAGAQPADVLTQVLEQAWAESQPVLTMAADGAAGGDVCGPDGCSVD